MVPFSRLSSLLCLNFELKFYSERQHHMLSFVNIDIPNKMYFRFVYISHHEAISLLRSMLRRETTWNPWEHILQISKPRQRDVTHIQWKLKNNTHHRQRCHPNHLDRSRYLKYKTNKVNTTYKSKFWRNNSSDVWVHSPAMLEKPRGMFGAHWLVDFSVISNDDWLESICFLPAHGKNRKTKRR